MHLRLELLLFWLLLHLILHQQPSVCRGALLRCGFVAVAFVFADVHRRNVLASFHHFYLHFLCMRAGQVVSVPARAMRRCVVCVPSGVWPGRASGASLSVVAGAGQAQARARRRPFETCLLASLLACLLACLLVSFFGAKA